MKDKRAISVIDAETDPFLFGRVPVPFLWGYFDGHEYRSFASTEDLILFIRSRNEYIYAHNGGKFDFHFLLKYIDGISQVLVINGRIVQMRLGKCILRDSFASLPFALKNYKKTEIDYAKFEASIRNQYMNEINDYLRDDCVYLWQLINAFQIEFGNKPTLASAGLAKLKLLCGLGNFKTNRFFYTTFAPYYHGGRVSIFHKGIVKKKTYIYDINSAYPYAMIHAHPWSNQCTFRQNQFTINPLSFYRVKGISHGCFPYLENKNLTYPVNRVLEYYVTGYELDTALKSKSFDGDILQQIDFMQYQSFSQYILHYYARKKASANDKHSTEYLLSKFAMNSVYGKFAANPDNYVDYILCHPKHLKTQIEKHQYIPSYICDDYALLAKEIPDARKTFYNVATAASITGFVRAYLWKNICDIQSRGYEVYYCDTDSMITDCPNFPCGSELGEWKLEQINDLLYLYAPKIYAAHSLDGKWKIASKGVTLTHQEIAKLLHNQRVTWSNSAPTFSLKKPVDFISRTL